MPESSDETFASAAGSRSASGTEGVRLDAGKAIIRSREEATFADRPEVASGRSPRSADGAVDVRPARCSVFVGEASFVASDGGVAPNFAISAVGTPVGRGVISAGRPEGISAEGISAGDSVFVSDRPSTGAAAAID